MYNEHLVVKDSKIGSKGVFTTVRIPANIPIFEVTGTVYSENELPDPNHPALLQVGPNTFIGPSGDVDDYINHSCDPNCKMHVVGNRAIVYSLYVIPAGSELTFDYSTTSTDEQDKWSMECKCNSNKCRKLISGFQYIDPATQREYIRKNLVPLYIAQPNLIKKRD